MSIKIKTISMVRIPPPKCRKYLFHVALTKALNIIRAFIINKYRRKNYEKVLGFADVRCNVSRLDSL